MKDDKIFVIIKRPFEPVGRIRQISNTLETFRELVGGYIETLAIDDAVLVFNRYSFSCEKGRIRKLPEQNRSIAGFRIAGTVILAGHKGDEFTDAPIDSLVEWENKWLGEEGGK